MDPVQSAHKVQYTRWSCAVTHGYTPLGTAVMDVTVGCTQVSVSMMRDGGGCTSLHCTSPISDWSHTWLHCTPPSGHIRTGCHGWLHPVMCLCDIWNGWLDSVWTSPFYGHSGHSRFPAWYIYIYIYSQTSPTDHLPRSTLPCNDCFIWVPSNRPYITVTIF